MSSPFSCGQPDCTNCKKCGGPSRLNKACVDALRETCEPKPKPDFQKLYTDSDTAQNKATTASDTQLRNLGTILFDIIGAFAFFIMITTIFWITASFYVKRLLVELYYAPRKTQLIVGIILALAILGIAIHVTVAKQHKRVQAKLYLQVAEKGKCTTDETKKQKTPPAPVKSSPPPRPPPPPAPVPTPPQIVEKNRSPFFMCGRRKQSDNRIKGGSCKRNCPLGNSKGHPFCPKYDARKCKKPAASNLCLTLADKATSTPMSDEEGIEIFRNYRTYSYPMDMKSPPALLVHLRDYIVNCFCSGNQNRPADQEVHQ